MININLTGIVIHLIDFLTLFVSGLTLWKWKTLSEAKRNFGTGLSILGLIVMISFICLDINKQ